jgi:DmsE family decaheme c-type cytochrome
MGQLNGCVRNAFLVVGVTLGLTFPLSGQADDIGAGDDVELPASPLAEPDLDAGAYADAEADDCMDCHDQDAKYPVLSILATPHAMQADPRTPLASTHECQTCHGASAAHMEDDSDTPPPPEIAFGPDAPADLQNEKCLGCHQGGKRMGWAGSKHDLQNVACADCHTIHALEDPVMVKDINPMVFARKGQASVCFQCHKDKRAHIQHRVSSHPMREGKVECSDCHDPHGSIGPASLVRPTLNETCYQCHAEKRGPFLWEHAPVREDCGTCHTPHGSNNPTLLVTRQPQLCQQCHMASRHPSTPYGGATGSPLVGERRVGLQSCLNCHSTIHGSNHPSGVRWVR